MKKDFPHNLPQLNNKIKLKKLMKNHSKKERIIEVKIKMIEKTLNNRQTLEIKQRKNKEVKVPLQLQQYCA